MKIAGDSRPQIDEIQVLSALHHTIQIASVLASRVADLQERLLGERNMEWWRRVGPLIMETKPKIDAKNRTRLTELFGFEPLAVATPPSEKK